jgi:hypothetical protein
MGMKLNDLVEILGGKFFRKVEKNIQRIKVFIVRLKI